MKVFIVKYYADQGRECGWCFQAIDKSQAKRKAIQGCPPSYNIMGCYEMNHGEIGERII